MRVLRISETVQLKFILFPSRSTQTPPRFEESAKALSPFWFVIKKIGRFLNNLEGMRYYLCRFQVYRQASNNTLQTLVSVKIFSRFVQVILGGSLQCM